MAAKLKARDPRNPKHIRAAMKILQDHSKTRLTTEGAMVLKVLGLERPPGVAVSNVPRKNERAVCSFFFIENGLLLADNVILTCCICRAPLQMRPSSTVVREKICVFCAAEDILQELATKSAKRAKSGASPRGDRSSRVDRE